MKAIHFKSVQQLKKQLKKYLSDWQRWFNGYFKM